MDLEEIAVLLYREEDDLPVKYICRKCGTENNAAPEYTGDAEWATWRCPSGPCGHPVHICRHCPGISIDNLCKKVHAHVRGQQQLAHKSKSHGANICHRYQDCSLHLLDG